MVNFPLFAGFHTCQVVSRISSINMFQNIAGNGGGCTFCSLIRCRTLFKAKTIAGSIVVGKLTFCRQAIFGEFLSKSIQR